jgi:hypothetical protein
MASGRMTSEAALMSWVAVGTVKLQMEALPLPAGQTRQVGETNLDDGGELREGCLRDPFEMERMMAFWLRRRPCRARPLLCRWSEY